MPDSRSATLSEIVADALRQALRDGVYACGEHLIELTIAHEMSVSQNTVRDALRLLEQEGWVVRRPRHGITVREFTPAEVEELCAVRIALEGLTLNWAQPRMTADQLAELRRIVADGQAQAEAHHLAGAREAIFAFHAALSQIAARPHTATLLQRLYNQLRLLENLRQVHVPRDRKQWRGILRDYAAVVDCLASAEPTRARAALTDILNRDCLSLMAMLDLV